MAPNTCEELAPIELTPICDDFTVTAISDLPNELLIEIFRSFSWPVCSSILSLVCRRWKNVILDEPTGLRALCRNLDLRLWKGNSSICPIIYRAEDLETIVLPVESRSLNLPAIIDSLKTSVLERVFVVPSETRTPYSNSLKTPYSNSPNQIPSSLAFDPLLPILPRCRQLSHLELHGTFATDRTLDAIISEQLKSLSIQDGPDITSAALSRLVRKSPHMTSLAVTLSDHVDNSFLVDLTRHLPSLQCLDLSFCWKITGEGLLRAAPGFLSLKHLNLSMCQSVSDKLLARVLSHLSKLVSVHLPIETGNAVCEELLRHSTTLEKLSLPKCSASAKVVKAMVIACSRLSELDLSQALHVDDSVVMSVLSNCKSLKKLDIQGARLVNFESFVQSDSVPECVVPTLRSLDLSHLRLDFDGDALRTIARTCTNLEEVFLVRTTGVTSDSIFALFTLCPNLKRIGMSDVGLGGGMSDIFSACIKGLGRSLKELHLHCQSSKGCLRSLGGALLVTSASHYEREWGDQLSSVGIRLVISGK
mmetsp:Transcript_30555/g.51438  ORF Transcript_30555/g.51438 Transcript_30555/m.51438 type:complete len:534 (-) Transcript_30555:826-2427(-)|eukprot:CAMPEP_0184349856 /NCGR_PEP_ID=MMETSP1089-20130417/37312_1 /TAXON_ID=38269 ORGANISM="Gloeochaete wittrockiana, Strain SAG46.84" /NCGR_SAMPLE_ID=MMETSP1089 /ASSEMBLY_ACC=CAM_ASM_000445 /LENGTH=533 /DNA_ID=CAMNT_0026682343 /DNA_START=131 /DNA_END=1732 /DNA_ORIENTATION=-